MGNAERSERGDAARGTRLLPGGFDFRVKGAAIRATQAIIHELHGDDGYERFVMACKPPTVALLRGQVLVSSWYRGELFADLTETAQALFGGEIARTLGERSAELALGHGGIYEIFTQMGKRAGFERWLLSSEEIYRLYYDRGGWEVEEMVGLRAQCRFRDGTRFPPCIADRLFAFVRRAFELVGAAGVKVEARPEGADYVVRITWSHAPAPA
jgi:hypothetical protein